MPSITATPASLTITGATAGTIPYRFTGEHASLTITGATATVGPGTGTNLSVTTPSLDRLYRAFDKQQGETDKEFQRRQLIWQQTMEAIEDAFAALTTQVADNTTLLNRIAAAQALAQAANDNAQTLSDRSALQESYTNPLGVLTAENTGIITIAAHDRIYTDGNTVSVNSGSVSGFSSGDQVTVYYEDAARVGGTVSYLGTTNAVAQTGTRHVVGTATIPASGEPASEGTVTPPPGYTGPPGTLIP